MPGDKASFLGNENLPMSALLMMPMGMPDFGLSADSGLPVAPRIDK
jgi:hypothetical protein